MIPIELSTLTETQALGEFLGKVALPGDIITLEGGLGAGKTTLAQFVARGIEVDESFYITSPSFSLLHEYPGRIPFYHFDLYRINNEEELEMLGFEEYFYGDGLTIIEWPERLCSLMPTERLHLVLSIVNTSSRRAMVTPHGESWKQRFSAYFSSQ